MSWAYGLTGFVNVPPVIIVADVAPTSANYKGVTIGQLWVNTATQTVYSLASLQGNTATWVSLGSGSGTVDAVLGTANQVTVNTVGNTATASLPSAVIAPGSIAATTTLTATLGAITATNGNVVLGTAGNKLVIATGANASAGTSAAMTAGAVTVATTASSATALIFYARRVTGGTTGDVSITAQDATGFTLTSTSNTETSTFNWWIINA